MNNDQNNQVPEYMFKMDFDKYEKREKYTTIAIMLLIAAIIITSCLLISELLIGKEVLQEVSSYFVNNYNILLTR